MNTIVRFELQIPVSIYLVLLQQARAELPNECCGLLAGIIDPTTQTAMVKHAYPLINQLQSPTEYRSEPKSLLQACRAIRQHNLEILATYHSHPTSDPIPSQKDLQQNYSEAVMCLIIGLKGVEPDVRGWWLQEEKFEQGDLSILQLDSQNAH